MTEEEAGEVGVLKTHACLLLVVCLWPSVEQALATPSPGREAMPVGGEDKKCCLKWPPDPEGGRQCVDAEDEDCKSHPRRSCADSTCSYCLELPDCAEGEQLVRLGTMDFTFKCEPCKRGTYSNVKNSCCRSWTDCESSGLLTVKPGNRTHNALCGFPVKDLMEVLNTSESLHTTILAVLTAVAALVLVQLTLFLHFCLWSTRRGKHHVVAGQEYNLPRLSPGSHHKDDTYSCQFPEEEHGYKTLEEKPCYFYPQSLQ
ncbi:tumor necrosis factor receptor superfamily member 18-like [Eudromia elegans]